MSLNIGPLDASGKGTMSASRSLLGSRRHGGAAGATVAGILSRRGSSGKGGTLSTVRRGSRLDVRA